VTAIPRDDDLPGFQEAFDMRQVTHDLEEALPRLGTVSACRIDRFRYRKSARATFLYEVRSDAGQGWITGTQWPGTKAWKSFKKNEGSGYATRTHMLLETFPHDAKMPGIARTLLEGHQELAETLRQLHGRTMRVLSVKPVRYRPHIACVLLVTVEAASRGGQSNYYMKFYADENVQDIVRVLNSVSSAGNSDFLRPAAVIPAINAILWPQVPGTALSQFVADGNGSAAISFAASALRAFHESAQRLPVELAPNVVQQEITKHTTFIQHFLPEQHRNLAALCNALPMRFSTTVQLPAHTDMKPEHVLVGSESCTFIDVEGLALSDPALDIGNMVARLEAMSWQKGIDPSRCKNYADLFVRDSVPLEPARLSAAVAFGRVKLATYAISHQVEGASTVASQLIEAAAAGLDADKRETKLRTPRFTSYKTPVPPLAHGPGA
jgi:streptomycin 6-kinase